MKHKNIVTLHNPAHPGEILREYLEPNLSLEDLSVSLEVAPLYLLEVLEGRKPITKALALTLNQQYGTTGTFWLNLSHSRETWEFNNPHEAMFHNPIISVPFVDIYDKEENIDNLCSRPISILLKTKEGISNCLYHYSTKTFVDCKYRVIPTESIEAWYYPTPRDYDVVCKVISDYRCITTFEQLLAKLKELGIYANKKEVIQAYDWSSQAFHSIAEHNFATTYQVYTWDKVGQRLALIDTVHTQAELQKYRDCFIVSFIASEPHLGKYVYDTNK